MAITLEELKRVLHVDEPDYAALARWGRELLPLLEQLAQRAEPGLAAKAVYLASRVPDGDPSSIIAAGAQRSDAVVRVAAASVIARASDQRMADIAVHLVVDADPSIRRRVIDALPAQTRADVQSRIARGDIQLSDVRKGEVLADLSRVREPASRGPVDGGANRAGRNTS